MTTLLESVKLNAELVQRYRELSAQTQIPITRFIQKAMLEYLHNLAVDPKPLYQPKRQPAKKGKAAGGDL